MKRNVADQKVRFSLFKAGARIANPTIAPGDFKRDLDGAGQSNVTTPPTSDAAGLVTWEPSAAETNADCVTLLAVDAAGDEWAPLTIVFYTEDSTSIASLEADVWAYATRTLTSASTAPGTGLTAKAWTVYRGDTLSRTFATIAADAGITKCQLTVKTEDPLADTGAILAVDSTTGLLRLNGAAPGAFTATFVAATGVLTVPAATMAQINQASFTYDVQVWHGAVVTTIEHGTFKLVNDVTRTVTP